MAYDKHTLSAVGIDLVQLIPDPEQRFIAVISFMGIESRVGILQQ